MRPIAVHFDDAFSADQRPRAEQVLAALELSWDIQVDQLGFRPPVLPDDAEGPELDVYLIQYQPGAAFVSADNYQDDVPGDGYNGTSTYMVIDARLPRGWIDSYAAHEFNHVLQYATDFSEPTLPIWEGTATAAQAWTFGELGYWDYDVGDFQEAALWPSLLSDSSFTYAGGGVGYLYEYGAALWVMFLDEKVGVGDGTMGPALWENAANEGFDMEPDVVDAFAATVGAPVGDALNQLALVRFLTGDDWDPRGLAAAAAWGPEESVPAWPLAAADLPLTDRLLAQQPYVTGHVYVDVDLADVVYPTPGEPMITVAVASAAAMDTGLLVMWWDDAGQVGEASTWGTDPQLELAAEGLTRITVALTNLGPAGWDGDDGPYRSPELSLSITPTAQEEPTTEPSDPPDTTPTTPDETDPAQPLSGGGFIGGGGCGCAHGSPASLLPLLLAPWFVRRRPTGGRPRR